MSTNGGSNIGNPTIEQADAAYEQCLSIALANILHDSGYQSCSGRSFQMLMAALEHFLLRVGRSTRAYAEAGGRTQPVLGDATMALVDYGVTVSALIDYARQASRHTGTAAAGGAGCQGSSVPAVFGHDWLAEAALRRSGAPERAAGKPPASQALSRPSHVPDHLPAYPRPHTFVSTPAFRPPPAVEDFDARRRQGAEHRRLAEMALTRFLASTGQAPPHSLFQGESYAPQGAAYRLTANELSPRPYVAALLSAVSPHEEAAASAAARNPHARPDAGHPNPFLRPAKFPL